MIDHVAWAKHNEAFVNSLDASSTPYRDWAITGIFYSSVHYIEAALDRYGKHSADHGQRNTFMKLHLKNDDIFDGHRDLYEISRNARYNCKIISESDIQESKGTLEEVKINVRRYVTISI